MLNLADLRSTLVRAYAALAKWSDASREAALEARRANLAAAKQHSEKSRVHRREAGNLRNSPQLRDLHQQAADLHAKAAEHYSTAAKQHGAGRRAGGSETKGAAYGIRAASTVAQMRHMG